MNTRVLVSFLAAFLLMMLVDFESALAKDDFLTVGGGYNPSGNQVSLEKNVVFMQKVLAEERPDYPQHDIYFADGNDDGRDVHFRDPDFDKTCPPAANHGRAVRRSRLDGLRLPQPRDRTRDRQAGQQGSVGNTLP